MTLPVPTPADLRRFMSYVDRLPSGCWFWTGGRSRGAGNRKWYGTFWYQGVVVRAHRFSCEFVADPPKPCPPGHHRDHTCEFSLCVAVAHLEVVTHEENERRRQARRRARRELS